MRQAKILWGSQLKTIAFVKPEAVFAGKIVQACFVVNDKLAKMKAWTKLIPERAEMCGKELAGKRGMASFWALVLGVAGQRTCRNVAR